MIQFDCYSTEYKNPQGALRAGDKMHFCIKVFADAGIEYVNIVLRSSDSRSFKLIPTVTEKSYTKFEGDIELNKAGLYYYRFELVKPNGIMIFAGSDDGHTVKCGDWLSELRLAVYERDFHTSDFTDGAVMYQIFPDRFYKADGVDISGAHNERIIHENWDERPLCIYDYPEYKCNDFFCGNLKGIEQKLPYLKSLGVTHIYLNPIFESSENHRYATSDYMRIDPYLGDTVHFKNLCKSAENMNIKIILDGVFSHTGDDSKYFNKYRHFEGDGAYNSKLSPYYDWYDFKNYPDSYECWWGFKTLPNVKETNPSYMEFITGENGVLRYWMRQGAHGWRLDVADELPDEFLEAVRNAVKTENRDALIIGEVWENAVTKCSYGAQRKFLLGKQCDTVMNYPFSNAITDFVISGNANRFYLSVMQIINDYPAPALKCLMNMLSTHDTSRIINKLSGAQAPERRYEADCRLSEDSRKLGLERVMTAVVIQYTLPGIPCVFYGDEVGVEGFGDPACRKTFPWGKEEGELLELHRALGKMRNDNPADFQSDMVFEFYDKGLLRYRRGRFTVLVNKTGGDIQLPSGEYIIKTGITDSTLKNGGAIIYRS